MEQKLKKKAHTNNKAIFIINNLIFFKTKRFSFSKHTTHNSIYIYDDFACCDNIRPKRPFCVAVSDEPGYQASDSTGNGIEKPPSQYAVNGRG